MAPVYVPGVAKIAVNQTLYGQQVENILYVKRTDGLPWPINQLGDVAAAVEEAWIGNIIDVQAVPMNYVSVTVTDISMAGGAQAIKYPTDGPIDGDQTGDSLPGGSAFVVKFLTGRVGRSFRGRNYIAGIPESLCALGAVGATFIEGVLNFYETFMVNMTSFGYQWVVVSRQLNGATLTPPASIPVTSVGYSTNAVRSQRRRNVGIGP